MSGPVIDRRMLAQLLAAGSGMSILESPLMALITGVLSQVVTSQVRADTSRPTGLYLHLFLEGGMSRWDSDLLLTPYDDDLDRFKFTNTMCTRLAEVGGAYVNTEWKTIKMHGLNVPTIWGEQTAAAAGGTRPMGDLLKHLVNIRGIYLGRSGSNDDHGAGQNAVFPGEGPFAPAALAAGYATTPIPGISLNCDVNFRNPSGLAPLTARDATNYLEVLLRPFIGSTPAAMIQKKAQVEAEMAAANAGVADFGMRRYSGFRMHAAAIKAARDLLGSSLAEIGNVWKELYGKYSTLCSRALDISWAIPGVTDKPIHVVKEYTFRQEALEASFRLPDGSRRDARTMFRTDSQNPTKVMLLPETMAVAEYMFTRGLTNSITGMLGRNGLFPLYDYGWGTRDQRFSFDEHAYNRCINAMLRAHYNRALNACILELKDRLAEKGLWERTVVNVSGEMGRSAQGPSNINDRPTEDSDHGLEGFGPALYCGAMSEPMVIGNVNRNGSQDPYHYTWGAGAPVAALGGKMLDIGHYTATLATLLNVPVTVVNKPSLILMRDGRIESTIEKATIVTT